nr:MAG TPA: hypothetical protein [Caudoviricetes sp.]DAZ63737.1 MAG TPA: hypothetical protein [Caudoviricetes sp.]
MIPQVVQKCNKTLTSCQKYNKIVKKRREE